MLTNHPERESLIEKIKTKAKEAFNSEKMGLYSTSEAGTLQGPARKQLEAIEKRQKEFEEALEQLGSCLVIHSSEAVFKNYCQTLVKLLPDFEKTPPYWNYFFNGLLVSTIAGIIAAVLWNPLALIGFVAVPISVYLHHQYFKRTNLARFLEEKLERLREPGRICARMHQRWNQALDEIDLKDQASIAKTQWGKHGKALSFGVSQDGNTITERVKFRGECIYSRSYEQGCDQWDNNERIRSRFKETVQRWLILTSECSAPNHASFEEASSFEFQHEAIGRFQNAIKVFALENALDPESEALIRHLSKAHTGEISSLAQSILTEADEKTPNPSSLPPVDDYTNEPSSPRLP